MAKDTSGEKSMSLPAVIDGVVALNALRSQRANFLSLISHCLPQLANSLLSKHLIPPHLCQTASNQALGNTERGMALLDCLEGRVQAVPADFFKLLGILQADSYLDPLHKYLLQSYSAISTAPTTNSPPLLSSALSSCQAYLKIVYSNCPISPDAKWGPTPSTQYISLLVMKKERMCQDYYIGHTLLVNINFEKSKEISLEQLLEAEEGQTKPRVVLLEGAPGIGKSTLAWELCRKWEEFFCMKQFSLVLLLRLREEEVQSVASLQQLFSTYQSQDHEALAEEVSKSRGRGILFVLDGFDELPKPLQQKGFYLDIIKGQRLLPESTVLVTSRPSATRELLTSIRPQRHKHVEVLGFTQESVEKYASSLFSSQPEKLEKFKTYISASMNPAINSLMYVPLNAAIIAEIFSHSNSDSFLPHTLTELYIQLCLTILNRNLDFQVKDFMALPSSLYKQFLHLSKVAFQAVKEDKVILSYVPPDLLHFGFIDVMPSLYGGGGVSYNFLHLTVQEFFAAYHIAHLGSSGLELFQEYGKVQRWNVVWRFVAGLTKFKDYTGHIDSSIFFQENEPLQFSLFFSVFLKLRQ